VSWIHIDDVVNLYIQAIGNESWSGVYNAVAPHPVSNKTLMQTLATQHGGNHISAPVPAFVLKVVVGEMSVEVLKSTTVSNGKVEQGGYTFSFPHIEAAVQDLEKNAST
jgi:NAD dependent epimerase/dehydratase family enzyme